MKTVGTSEAILVSVVGVEVASSTICSEGAPDSSTPEEPGTSESKVEGS